MQPFSNEYDDLLITIEPSGIRLEPDGCFCESIWGEIEVIVQNVEKNVDIPGGVVIIDIYLISWENVGSSAV